MAVHRYTEQRRDAGAYIGRLPERWSFTSAAGLGRNGRRLAPPETARPVSERHRDTWAGQNANRGTSRAPVAAHI
jgi:hypothetical protein